MSFVAVSGVGFGEGFVGLGFVASWDQGIGEGFVGSVFVVSWDQGIGEGFVGSGFVASWDQGIGEGFVGSGFVADSDEGCETVFEAGLDSADLVNKDCVPFFGRWKGFKRCRLLLTSSLSLSGSRLNQPQLRVPGRTV